MRFHNSIFNKYSQIINIITVGFNELNLDEVSKVILRINRTTTCF